MHLYFELLGVRTLTYNFCRDTVQPITQHVAILSEGVVVAATALLVFTDRQQALDSSLGWGRPETSSQRGQTIGS